MDTALRAAAVVVLAADFGLVVICWRRHMILGGLCGAAGIALVVFAIGSGLTGSAGEAAVVLALIALVIGSVLFGLGQAIQRLLDDEPEETSCAEDRWNSTPHE